MEPLESIAEYDAWLLAEAQVGLDQIEKGQTISHKDVGKRLEAYLAGKQQPE